MIWRPTSDVRFVGGPEVMSSIVSVAVLRFSIRQLDPINDVWRAIDRLDGAVSYCDLPSRSEAMSWCYDRLEPHP